MKLASVATAAVGLVGFGSESAAADSDPGRGDPRSLPERSEAENPDADEDGSALAEAITPQAVNGDVYASQFEGDDLGAKVQRARDHLASAGTSGTIRITAKEDGSPWTWSTDVTHDADENAEGVGLDIICGANTHIQYDGTGWPLTVANTYGAGYPNSNFRLVGGTWEATSDAVGWLRLVDCTGDDVMPTLVDFRTPNGVDHPDRGHTGSVAVALENHDAWCELNTIEGQFKADNGIDFRPASVTGGSGTSSFQSTTIRDSMVNIHRSGGFAMRVRGNHGYCHYRRVSLHLNAPEARGIVLDSTGTNLQGSTFDSIKFENNDGTSGQVAIETTENYNGYYGPMFVGCHVSGSVDSQLNAVGGDDRLVRYTTEKGRAVLTGFGDDQYSLEFKPQDGTLEVVDPSGSARSI